MAHRARGAAAGARPAADSRSPRPAGARVRPWPDQAALRSRLRSIVEPIVLAAGLDLDDLTVIRAGSRHLVRVTVDGDAGIGHDELSEVSRDISVGLDAAEAEHGEFTDNPYTLEVSSPGVDRPLTVPRHWRRNVGRLVKVKANGRMLTARIASADDTGVTLDDAGRSVTYAFDRVGPGRVQVEFTDGEDRDEGDSDGGHSDGGHNDGGDSDGGDSDGGDSDGDGHTRQEDRP